MTILHNPIEEKLLSRMQSLMLHGLGFVTGDPTIKIGYPFLFHPGVQVTVMEPGDAKWIYMMLPITRGSLITNIKIAHHRSGVQSHVSLVRLVEQQEPIAAKILHDDEIKKNIPSTCVIDSDCHILVNHSILLKVCMDFRNVDDMIEFGSVEIRYIPDYKNLTRKNQQKKIKKIRKQKVESSNAGLNGRDFLNVQRSSLLDLLSRKKEKQIFK